jgi:hypothetical protein
MAMIAREEGKPVRSMFVQLDVGATSSTTQCAAVGAVWSFGRERQSSARARGDVGRLKAKEWRRSGEVHFVEFGPGPFDLAASQAERKRSTAQLLAVKHTLAVAPRHWAKTTAWVRISLEQAQAKAKGARVAVGVGDSAKTHPMVSLIIRPPEVYHYH